MSDTPQFEQMYECRFTETKEEAALRHLAREYHERTEAFDQLHCLARNERGIAIPVGGERVVCTCHALEVRAELANRALALGFGTLAFTMAIQDEARHFEAEWCSKTTP